MCAPGTRIDFLIGMTPRRIVAVLSFVALIGIVDSRDAFGVTSATIFATERMWKTNRKAALLTMIALNATYGAIAVHNYRVAAGQQRR